MLSDTARQPTLISIFLQDGYKHINTKYIHSITSKYQFVRMKYFQGCSDLSFLLEISVCAGAGVPPSLSKLTDRDSGTQIFNEDK